ncbi:MAG: thiamine phosphate synthase [Planctomycetes bacterium]|nr:thiamine phosphate synthase [Planctomycetota bacterium]
MNADGRGESASRTDRGTAGRTSPTNPSYDNSIGQAGVARIVDANLNRAREALRVMEEYARFVLADGGLSAALKQARHDLAAMVPAALAAALVWRRDSPGDVGRELTTGGEARREDAAHVALAAGKRLSEALRAVEEYGKTLDAGLAAAAEALRYRGYDLERRLALTARAQERFAAARLYVIVTEALCPGDWLDSAAAALEGGADVLQLREKALPDRELLARARRLAALCRERQAMLVINDRPDIALLAGADGVHLGQSDIGIAEARKLLPAAMLVGASTHTLEQVRGAAAAVPDYIAVGPMFATATKPQGLIAGPATLAEARRETALPLAAIGGIDVHNAGEVLDAAPCCICVCRAVIAQADPARAAARLRRLIERLPPGAGAGR